jgi:hypothetical protein
MKKVILYGTLIAAAFVACNSVSHEKELAEINKLRALLLKTDSLLGTVDHEEAEQLATEVKNNSQFIQFNITQIGDTIDFQTGVMISDYRALLKSFEIVDDSYKSLSSAVDSVAKNLDNLEHDLKNNSLSNSLTPEGCIAQEKDQANTIYERAGEIRSMQIEAKTKYDSLAPKIKDYMLQLNQAMNQLSPTDKK